MASLGMHSNSENSGYNRLINWSVQGILAVLMLSISIIGALLLESTNDIKAEVKDLRSLVSKVAVQESQIQQARSDINWLLFRDREKDNQ